MPPVGIVTALLDDDEARAFDPFVQVFGLVNRDSRVVAGADEELKTEGVAREFTDVKYDEKIVDATCMHLVMNPGIFDVLVLLGREESLARIADRMA